MQQIFQWWERFSNPNYIVGEPVGGISVSESVLTMPASPQELQFWSNEFLVGSLTRPEYIAKLKELGAYTEAMEKAAAENPQLATLGLNGAGVLDRPVINQPVEEPEPDAIQQ